MIRFHAISRLEGRELDGIHLVWSPPVPAGHSLDGFSIFRRSARGEKPEKCIHLSAEALREARARGMLPIAEALIWADVKNPDTQASQVTYRVELPTRHSVITVTANVALATFAGTPDGSVIAATAFTGGPMILRGSDLGVVWVVTDSDDTEVRICGDVAEDPEWADEVAIVKGLQVPFETVNSAVGSVADGRALAELRALPERLGGDFTELSAYANAALRRPDGAPPWSVIAEKPGGTDDAWDVSPYGLAMASTLLAPWRRGWGFSHLDTEAAGLVPGGSYDYRIVGSIRRRDRDERSHDLHTVPRGYRLPHCFRWGSTIVWSGRSPVVRALIVTPGLPGTIRKGFDTDRLVIRLDTPSPRIVLDLVPGGQVDAQGFRYGLPVAAGSTAAGQRTLLDFGVMVDTVVVTGNLGVAGIIPAPIDPALDPDEPVPISQTIYDVDYVPTPAPPTPDSIAVTNLSDPARTAARGILDTNRGLEIEWPAPPSIDPNALPYMPPSVAASPTDVAYYVLERSLGGPFLPTVKDGIHVSGRNASTGTDPAAYGFDVLRAFPPVEAAPSSFGALVRAVEIFGADELAYGDTVTYQVSSVDATGRRSSPRVSGPTPLRKFVRPPAPTTPPHLGPPPPADAVPVSGVEVRLLQPDDPELTAADRVVAAGNDTVVIRWGWGETQRELDPDVTEFRVYRHGSALTALEVSPAGVPSATGSGWDLPVQISRPVAENEFAGIPVAFGLAYQIVGHGAGTSVVLSLAPSPVDATRAPVPRPVTLNRTTSAELNPEYWDQRVQVVARTPAPAGSAAVEGYRLVLPATTLGVDAAAPRRRLAYGVTAADNEQYVPDRRAAVEPAPRPGNESTVAAAEVTARYYGRPTLILADLADVPALTAARQAGNDVHVRLRPADYLPPGFTATSRMLLDRVPAATALSRLRVEPGAISLIRADGTAQVWALSPADEQALRAGHDADLVPDRFLAHAASRLDGFDDDAEKLGAVDPVAVFEDTLPNRPSRWLYRLRAVDTAGRPSVAAQLLALVVKVPSEARAVAPRIDSLDIAGRTATVRLDCRRLAGTAYVFLGVDESLRTTTASLATIRNRPDLTPLDRLVVRDPGGRRLEPMVAVPDATGYADVVTTVPSGGFVVHAWAIAVSADGVPSRLAGPVHAGLPAGM